MNDISKWVRWARAGVGAGAAAIALSMATGANAAKSVELEDASTCNIYAEGCLFSWSGGGAFDDWALIAAEYNAEHAPPTIPLPPEIDYLGKAEFNRDGTKTIPFDVASVTGGTKWTFTDLTFPYLVSFYTIKQSNEFFLLFGLEEPSNDVTAINTRISPTGGISHVTFFGGPSVAVPEPATWAMMIGGFAAVGSMVRRRKSLVAA